MPRLDSHRPQINSQNAKSNPDIPNLTARCQKVTPVIPKTDSQMPKIKNTSNKAAKSRLKSPKIDTKRPNTPNFKYISRSKPKLKSQRAKINFSCPKSTFKDLKLTLKFLITTPIVPNLTHTHQKSTPTCLKFKKCSNSPFTSHKPTSICLNLTPRGSKIVSHMPRIDWNRLSIDSQNAKSNPDGQKPTARWQKAIPWIPKQTLRCLKSNIPPNRYQK